MNLTAAFLLLLTFRKRSCTLTNQFYEFMQLQLLYLEESLL